MQKVNERFNLWRGTWQDFSDRVHSTNPEFAKLVDDLSPGEECPIYLARYRFGDQYAKNGHFGIPLTEGGVEYISDPNMPQAIYDDLSYNTQSSNPMTFVLNKGFEAYFTAEDRVVSFALIKPGSLIGIWDILDHLSGDPNSQQGSYYHSSPFTWNFTAGARSTFLLPKVSSAASHIKLKQHYHIKSGKPNSLTQHWRIFKELANSPYFDETWEMEVLLFPQAWIDRLRDKAWAEFRYYLFCWGWHVTDFLRNQYIWNLIFARIQHLWHVKTSAYIADSAKHIFTIGVGGAPGFVPATDEQLLPLRGIQQAYTEHYGLKEYAPIIMQPASFDLHNTTTPVYYSLHFATASELSPKSSNRTSVISDLYDVRALMEKYLRALRSNDLNIAGSRLYDLAQRIELKYYHDNVELYEGMKESQYLPNDDPNFAEAMKGYEDREFPRSSTFLKGAVAINCQNDTGDE